MTDALSRWAKKCAAPAERCRITIIPACKASKFLAVSCRDSPFRILLVSLSKDTTSALNRIAANSKEILVRVLGSINKLTTVRPCRDGTFLIGLPKISLKTVAVDNTFPISSAFSSRKDRRSFLCHTPIMISPFQSPLRLLHPTLPTALGLFLEEP